MNKGQKVFVGMSGGVDSSVSAALLVEQGYDVTGVFIKVWEPPQEKFQKVCTSRDDRRDAMRVAAKLGIPFITIDLSAEYKQGVVDYMIAEYKAGRTPNPDVMCNKMVKFGAFYDWAIKNGADFVATGHYAEAKNGQLLKAVDDEKDQTYFIWNLTSDKLKHVLFPIGGYKKSVVRDLAREYDLPTATKKDSQGLCFIGKLDVKDFLREFISPRPGEVVNEAGEVVGTHSGVEFYTIGERHGFNVRKQTPDDRPFFVVAKDLSNNRLVVSNTPKESQTQLGVVSLINVSWVLDTPTKDKSYKCQFRYRQKLLPCRVEEVNNLWVVYFSGAQAGITKGQSLVLYDNDVCMGGGIIV